MNIPADRTTVGGAIATFSDYVWLAQLSDLYAETKPQELQGLDTIQRQLCQGIDGALESNGRLSYSPLIEGLLDQSGGDHQRVMARLNEAMQNTLMVSIPLSQRDSQKGLVEYSIETARVNIVRHLCDQLGTAWMKDILSHPVYPRLTQHSLSDAFTHHTIANAVEGRLLSCTGEALDALTATTQSNALLEKEYHRLAESFLYRPQDIHIQRIEDPAGQVARTQLFTWAGAMESGTAAQDIATGDDSEPMTVSQCLESMAQYHADLQADGPKDHGDSYHAILRLAEDTLTALKKAGQEHSESLWLARLAPAIDLEISRLLPEEARERFTEQASAPAETPRYAAAAART